MRVPDVAKFTAAPAGWLTPGRFASLLAAMVLVSWPQVFLGLQTFVYRDFGLYAYPIAYHLRESFWHGEIPLWNPLSNCGVPFLAQWNTQVLYPPALFYVLLPLQWSLAVFCLLHLYLGGLGMFLLARRWSGNSMAAAVAGVAFAFGGLMLNCLMWPGTIPGLAWMPWLVWFGERAWREGRRTVVVAVIIGSLQMLSGAAEPVLLTWLVLGLLWLADFFRGEWPRAKMILRGAGLVAGVAGLCAAQLLPFFDLLQHSSRRGNFDAAQWPMPPMGWANLLVPLFHCNGWNSGVFMQSEQSWTASYYVGVVIVALAAVAMWRSRSVRVWLLISATWLCLMLALGEATPVYGWLRDHVGLLGLIRFPVKFVILPVFALPLLAALGLAQKQNVAPEQSANSWVRFWLVVVAVIAALVWWDYRWPALGEDWRFAFHNALVRVALFTAIVGILFRLQNYLPSKTRMLVQIAVLLLIWLDLSRSAQQPQTAPPAIYEPNLSRSLPSPRPGFARAMLSREAYASLTCSTLSDVVDDYVSRRFALFSNCNLLDGIAKVDGFFPLALAGQQVFFSRIYATNVTPVAEPLLDFVGVAQVSSPTNIFDWTPRSTSLPMLTGGQKPIFADARTAVDILVSTNFNPRAEVYLFPDAKSFVPNTNATAVKISDEHFDAQHIEARVEAAAPGLVVIAQTFYNPWRAYVDGAPVAILHANYDFQAVAVPAGAHELKLVYEDRSFFCGAIISLVTLLACVLAWLAFTESKSAPQSVEL